MPNKAYLDSLSPERRQELRDRAKEQARARRAKPEVRERERELNRTYEKKRVRPPLTPEQREKAKARFRRYNARHADKRRAYQRQYRAENAEKLASYWQEYRQSGKGRETARRSAKAYRQRHPEVARLYQWRKRNAPSAERAWAAILLNDPCCYCGAPMQEIDHIVPVTKGGDGTWENLTAACLPCNRSKKNIPLLLWLARHPAMHER